MTIGILELQTYPYVSPFRNLIHEVELNFEKQAKLYLRTQYCKLPFKLKNTFFLGNMFLVTVCNDQMCTVRHKT